MPFRTCKICPAYRTGAQVLRCSLAAGLIYLPQPGDAEQAPGTAPDQASPIWTAGVGDGFRRGADEWGLSAGAGFGMDAFGPREHHHWWLTSLRYGRMLGGVVGENHWCRGNWQVMGELFGGEQFHPDNAYLVGLTPHLRYNFAAGSRWVPFVDAGAGVTFTDIRNGDLSTTFEFNLQAGGGVRCFLKDDLALTLEYKFIHLSNAHLGIPNLGVNNHTLLLGVSRLF